MITLILEMITLNFLDFFLKFLKNFWLAPLAKYSLCWTMHVVSPKVYHILSKVTVGGHSWVVSAGITKKNTLSSNFENFQKWLRWILIWLRWLGGQLFFKYFEKGDYVICERGPWSRISYSLKTIFEICIASAGLI